MAVCVFHIPEPLSGRVMENITTSTKIKASTKRDSLLVYKNKKLFLFMEE